MDRRTFFTGSLAFAAGAGLPRVATATAEDELLKQWQADTDAAPRAVYLEYLADGKTRGLRALENLESAFTKVLAEAKTTEVTDVPAVWSVYNMGYIVKTREALFSIDLVHRRSVEFAPLLDFALITHNHGDHWRSDFYKEMNGAGKVVISNFLDNSPAYDKMGVGGYTRAEKTFKLKDVEIRTSFVDHNDYLIDFTTAFEIKVGNWLLYHSGDCGISTKLRTTWGRPDLWLFFPGCGVDVADAVQRVRAKRTAFGHLWELAHYPYGRLSLPLINRARARAASVGVETEVPVWGTRLT